MSFNICSTPNSNYSPLLQSALNSFSTNTQSPYGPTVNSASFGNNVFPTFKMEMYKSQNDGFILNLIKRNPESLIDEGKLFILNDIENLGRDIQYILAMEILKK